MKNLGKIRNGWLLKPRDSNNFIKEPAGVTENSKSLIDVAFTNKTEIVCNSGVIRIGISDHSFIFIQRKILIIRKSPEIIKTRQLESYNVQNCN